MPKTRNQHGMSICAKVMPLTFALYADVNVFPSTVQECGITEEVLQRAFLHCLEGQIDLDLILTKRLNFIVMYIDKESHKNNHY